VRFISHGKATKGEGWPKVWFSAGFGLPFSTDMVSVCLFSYPKFSTMADSIVPY